MTTPPTLPTLDDLSVDTRAVFLRLDLNVPLTAEGAVQSDARLRAVVPGLVRLLDAGARVVMASHLGEPKSGRDEALSLLPVIEHLSGLIGRDIVFCDDVLGESPKVCLDQLRPGEAMALENLRFWPGEKACEPGFCRELAAGIDIYVTDAFASLHRAHASIVGVPPLVSEVGIGPLVAKELEQVGRFLQVPRRGTVAIVGGSKVTDKVGLLRSLCDRTECLMLGGALALPFLAAQGHRVGKNQIDPEAISLARSVIARAREKFCQLWLPEDHVGADQFSEDAAAVAIDGPDVPAHLLALDIGPKTASRYAKRATQSRAVFWNGPLGVSTWHRFAAGSRQVAEGVAACPELSIVGGGDSLAMLEQAGLIDKVRHASTGGGASLALLERGTLPGLEAIARARR